MAEHVSIIPEEVRVTDAPAVRQIHGDVFIDPFYIGTPRGNWFDAKSRFIRLHKDDFSTYDAFNLPHPTEEDRWYRGFEDAVYVPSTGKIYTGGVGLPTERVVVELDPLSSGRHRGGA